MLFFFMPIYGVVQYSRTIVGHVMGINVACLVVQPRHLEIGCIGDDRRVGVLVRGVARGSIGRVVVAGGKGGR